MIIENPIKIIHKFKNNNRNIQYIQYIFIGSNVDEDIMSILDSIKNKSFYDTLDYLSKNKIERLENYYGPKWFTFFFNKYHLSEQFNNILKNATRKKTIESKMGKEWVSMYLMNPLVKKTSYSFSSSYYDYLVSRNKIKTVVRKLEMDFRTYKPEIVGGNYMIGGNELEPLDDDEYVENKDTNEDINKEIESENEEYEEMLMTAEDFDDAVGNNFNLEELTDLYGKENEVSVKDIKDTAILIGQATNDKSFVKNISKLELDFNERMDDINYDVKLEDVYNKIYIKEQFIYMDDTIKTIRNKLCVTVPLSSKFSTNQDEGDVRLLPEYIYLWSEYNLNNTNIDRVMLGQKWVRRNELVMIDVKPNENMAVYENLRNNLSYLKDSFGIKIKREDDEHNILRDYDNYMSNNEIYMIDILNEFGLNYSSESTKKRNVYEVYVNIYFPLITFERFDLLLDLLNNNNDKELEKNINSFAAIKNDTTIEYHIHEVVDTTRNIIKDDKKFNSYFEPNYIIQSIIHLNLNNPKNLTGTVSSDKYNLFKIFDNFVVSEEHPFIQFQTPDSQLTYKFYTKTKKIDDMEILSKWFENAPYGISFKIKMTEIENKYISINLNENGRLEYKITWKEDDKATIEKIKDSYKYVNDLLLKINSENKKIKFILPEEENYKYAFINTIQKFSLPIDGKAKDKLINHNDLSDFSRFFYTYVALMIEPRKRIAKVASDKEDYSKYGTYLRYKRISNYENKTKMHLRMLYFLRNFEISDKELVDEIAKQFNITNESAAEELDTVRKKYGKVLGKIKKSLTKIKALPKAKPPGIGVDIQGRTPDNYKIRIAGARSKEQLDEIVSFVKVLLYLYVEIYIKKNSKYMKIKEMLSKLTKIAKRRNKVNDIVNYDAGSTAIKQTTSLDKKRLGFRPEEGQNQWTRSCQNSGEDKKRQPLVVSSDNVKELIKRGYKLNPKTDNYEKTTFDKSKKKEVVIKAVKLAGENGTFNFYTCDPDDNNEHCFVGFLSKSNNPNDLCMPCCFKKDQSNTNNKKKQTYFNQCIGQKAKETEEEKPKEEIGDKVYILQDTNKVQDGRFIFLPKYLNQFFNNIWKNTYNIKNHYLVQSNTGYYFKYTIKHQHHLFLAAISNIFDKSINELKDIAINALNDKIFTYLNNGDIKSMFKDIESYIDYIKNSNYLEYDIIGELLSIPGVLTKNGLIYFVFDKKIKIIKKALEKDTVVENYYLQCLNYENYHNINENRDYVILIKDGRYYFPIYNVKKGPKDKKIILTKKYDKGDLIDELKKYYGLSCIESFIFKINKTYNITAKNIQAIESIHIKKQIIDMRNKVRYLKLDNDLLVPVKPSGALLDVNISDVNSLKTSDFFDLDETIKLLYKFNKLVPDLNYVPKSIYYNNVKDKTYNIISILLMNNLIIPIKSEYVLPTTFKKYGLGYEFQSTEELIDTAINNNDVPYDTRTINIKNKMYKNESYNLFRLELSIFLQASSSIRSSIITIVRNDNINKKSKRKELLSLLTGLIEKKSPKFVEIIKELPDLKNYNISNVRDYCSINRNKDKCNMNLHCSFINNSCIFVMFKNDLLSNISKIIEECIIDGIKFKEIIQEENYYVSDVVDYTIYSDRPNQKIIKTSNFNIKKIMTELFGKDSIPQLGKRKVGKQEFIIDVDIPVAVEIGDEVFQEIISNKNSIIRGYVNCYYWLLNKLYDKDSRNLGYESELQERLTNLFKANMIDYLVGNVFNEELKKDISKYIELNKDILSKNIFTSSLSRLRKNNYNTDGVLELIILSYMFPFPIVVFDNYNAVKYIFSSGPVSVNDKTIEKYTNKTLSNKTIFMKFDFEGNNNIPKKIYSIYYK
uniref:Early transcription factor VETF large subunit n=1 Tax=viral metagenome TaxID=1070528 RepID=A0A6C0HVJ4_9ZZZZ